MDTLRILLTCGLRMERLITLLLLAPGLACAQQMFNITSGSPIVLQAFQDVPTFTIAGNGFSGEVSFGVSFNPLDEPLISDNTSQTLNMGVTINGVPWTDAPFDPMGGGAVAFFRWRATEPINGAGMYLGQFNFFASYSGAPLAEYIANGPLQCTNICQTLDFNGSGTATLDVTPFPNIPGVLVTEATLTFKAPEPSTTSLLLIAIAGLAAMSCRRRCRATLVPVG